MGDMKRHIQLRKYLSFLTIFAVLLAGSALVFAQDATPTETDMETPTAVATDMATEMPTEEMTEEATETDMEVTEEVTEEMTEEAMAPLTHVRLHHFAPDGPPVDLYVNDEIIVDDLAFSTSSQWLNIPAGTYELAVAPANTSIDDAIIGPTTYDLDADTWYNIAAVGSVGTETLMPTIFVEQLGLPLGDETTTRVTFFNAIEDGPTIDILADGEPLLSDLAYPDELDGNDGAYTVDIPAGTYELAAFEAGNIDNQLLDMGEVTLEAGTTYLIAAVGTADAPDYAILSVTDMQMAEYMGMEVEPTEEMTMEATEEMTEEMTEEPTMEATEEMTVEPTMEATEEVTVEPTSES